LTLSHIHADPDSSPSFADKCSFRNWSSDYIPLRERPQSVCMNGVVLQLYCFA